MGVSLVRSAAHEAREQWSAHCSAHAQALRLSAEGASPLQAERAVVEYGAAAALDRAAGLWLSGDDRAAQAWVAAAGAQLAAALLPVPWQ